MNRVDRYHAALAQAGERGDDDVSAGRESDGAVELHWRFLVFASYPGRSQRCRQPTMRLPARGDIHLAFPGAQNRDREVRRGAESEQADALARLYSGDTQAAEADDPGAQQRSGL